MNVMRYTIVDNKCAVSFVAGCESLEPLVAACAGNPRSVEDMLTALARYDARLDDYVSCGLAIFGEHNTEDHYQVIRSALRFCAPQDVPVFRVVDTETRRASLQPVKAGIVIFNLSARRIVQLHNTHTAIRRRGKVVVRDTGGKPRVYRYELPAAWVIVP
ncbi:MAG: hypothetical protein ACYC3S_16535 [Chloroflexota bacterium]